MLIDLINPTNTITVNLKLAQTVGLNAAVYCYELLTIYGKAKKKEKLIDEDYFKVDRKYVFSRTTLSIEDQIKCDQNLIKVNVIKKHADDPDVIKVDVDLLATIIACEDVKLLDNLGKRVKVANPKGVKQTQRQMMINSLKDSIECSNYELLTALRDWVDAVFANPNGFLSKSAIKTFQDTLNNYTQGDLDLALSIVKTCSIQGYKDCQWGINVYEKDKKIKAQQASFGPRVTTQQKAEKEDISDIVF